MISLFGHGYIGTAIADELIAQGVPFDWRHHLDLARIDGPVINAAGYTGAPNVDACEDQRNACWLGNVAWPGDLEIAAGQHPVLHIGSGCIYQGSKLWSERDRPNFTGSYYAFTKATSQDLLELYLTKSWLLRPRMPFGRRAHPKNLLTKLAQYPTLVNARNSLTCLEDLAKLVVYFVKERPPFGIYNAVNHGSLRTLELAMMMGIRPKWFESIEAFHETVKAPRSFCTLSTEKLARVYPMRPVEEALQECIAALREERAA